MPSFQLTAYRLSVISLLTLSLFAQSCSEKKPAAGKPILIDSATIREKNPYSDLDQSPMDMSYFPDNYPIHKMNRTDSTGLVARVIYSRPHKKNRVIFSNGTGSLCQYGKEWRLGANEATEIQFFRNVTIAGKNIRQGAYVIYAIPGPDKWTLALNSNLYSWGLHMDTTKDLFRTDVPVMVQNPPLEDFTMVFQEASYGADLLMSWDSVKTTLPIEFAK